MRLRPYQNDLKRDIYAEWQTSPDSNVLAVAPTGGGKTCIFSSVLQEHHGASVAIAHRQELVGQISLALARNGVRHRLIGASGLVRTCTNLHMDEVGKSYYDANAHSAVAGIDTLIRMDPNDPWLKKVTLGVQDEAHHMLRKNKWGRGAEMFPNAKWLGVTATPNRADGHGLGRHAGGIMDKMVMAPSMRDLITMGYLTDYRIFAPPSDIDLTNVPVSAGGDFSPDPLRAAVHKSHIVGDVVAHYLRIAPGKLGVTFAVDIASASEITAAFKAAGVPAEIITADTPDFLRAAILRKFRKRELLQLVNVDLFGEGFDLPAIEVVSMARPTQSFPLFAQQFGRSLRVMVDEKLMRLWDQFSDADRRQAIAESSKKHAIVIDHVNNVGRHGLPDARREFSLNDRDKKSRSAVIIPVRTCPVCAATYERTEIACPYCGNIPIPAERSGPEFVDGDLMELSPETLARLRGEIDNPFIPIPAGVPDYVIAGIRNRHAEKGEAQVELRKAMSEWCARRTMGAWESHEMRKAVKEFYFRFGVDVMSAQTLSRAEAEALTVKIRTTP